MKYETKEYSADFLYSVCASFLLPWYITTPSQVTPCSNKNKKQ